MLQRPTPTIASLHALRDLLRRPALAPLLAANIVLGLGVSFVTPFLSLFGTDAVGMSLYGFGAFMTANACANIAIATFIARRSDRGGKRRNLLLLGGLAAALGYFGYATVREVWLLSLIGMVVLGIGSITFAQLYAHTRELLIRSDLPASSAPLYMNTCRMAFALAWTFGPALAAWTLQAYGYTGLFLSAGALHIAFVLVVLFGLREPTPPARALPADAPQVPASPRQPQIDPGLTATPTLTPLPAPSPTLTRLPAPTPVLTPLPAPMPELRPELRPESPGALVWTPTLVRWFMGFCLIFTAQTMAFMNLPLFTLRTLGGNEVHVGVMYSVAPCFEVPLMLYVGWLATRMDAARLIRGASALAFIYYALLTCVGAPWHIYPLQLLSAAVISVMGGVAITFFQDKLPGLAGQATNLYGSASRVGATLGYLIFGVAAGGLGYRATYGVCAGLTALAFSLMPGPMAANPSASVRQ